MGKLNASTLASTPAPAAPAPAPAPAPKTTTPKPAPTGGAAAAPPARRAPVVPPDPAAPRTGSAVGDRILSEPAAEPPPGPASGPPIGFYSTRMREVEALRDQRRLGTDATPPTLFGGKSVDRPELTARAGPLSTRVRPKEGGEERVFSAYPTMEARTVPTSNQEEFVRRGERLGERYASLRRTLMDLADTRRELESLKKADAAPKDETATSDERLKSIARRTQSANRDMAQTLADLREFGIDEREAEEQYGSR